MGYLKELSDSYKLEPVITESGRNLERTAIISPLFSKPLVSIVPKEKFVFLRPFDFINEVDSVLNESGIPVTSKELFINDNGSKINVSYRTSMVEGVVENDEVAFGFNLDFNVSKDIKFEILSWRQVCENGLVSFVPVHKLSRESMISYDEIMQSISFCVNQFRESDIPKFRRMIGQDITKDDAMMEIGNYRMRDDDKTELFVAIEDKFKEVGEDKVSEWELFNVIMFVATHILTEKSRRLRSMARRTFSSYSICYHGVPHRFMNK
jgi:hypothetical protein